MATMNLRGMDVDALLSLRAEIDNELSEKRSELEQQLSRLGLESNSGGHARAARGWGSGRCSAMKGRRVGPKFREPCGESWVVRGAPPRWVTALVQYIQKIDEFEIINQAR